MASVLAPPAVRFSTVSVYLPAARRRVSRRSVPGREQADLYRSASWPSGVVDQELRVRLGPVLAQLDHAAADGPVAAGPGVEAELADELQGGDVGERRP